MVPASTFVMRTVSRSAIARKADKVPIDIKRSSYFSSLAAGSMESNALKAIRESSFLLVKDFDFKDKFERLFEIKESLVEDLEKKVLKDAQETIMECLQEQLAHETVFLNEQRSFAKEDMHSFVPRSSESGLAPSLLNFNKVRTDSSMSTLSGTDNESVISVEEMQLYQFVSDIHHRKIDCYSPEVAERIVETITSEMDNIQLVSNLFDGINSSIYYANDIQNMINLRKARFGSLLPAILAEHRTDDEIIKMVFWFVVARKPAVSDLFDQIQKTSYSGEMYNTLKWILTNSSNGNSHRYVCGIIVAFTKQSTAAKECMKTMGFVGVLNKLSKSINKTRYNNGLMDSIQEALLCLK